MTNQLEPRLSRAYDLILNQPLYLFLPQLVSHTHLAGPVRNGVVDQRDASHMCSVCQTPMGVPVPQAGGGCSAMKHVHTVTMGQTVSSGATVPMKRCVTASKDASALKDGKGCSVRKKAGQG